MFGNDALFLGCIVRNAFPEIGKNWHAITRALGKRLILLPEELCCGTPLLNAGERGAYEEQREKLRALFKRYHVRRIYTPCPSCAISLSSIVEAHHVLELVDPKKLKGEPLNLRVTFHDPCHLSRGLRLSSHVRDVLRACGCVVVEPPFSRAYSYCCGGGAGVPANAPHVAEKMGRERARQLLSTNPDVVVTACPMCIHTLRKYICSCAAPVWDISEILVRYLGVST